MNKTLQAQLKKEATFSAGIDTLLHLRQELMETLFAMKRELRREDFDAMPFPNVNGYHNKTIAYSIWHVFRIEDIVAHSLIQREPEVFRAFRERIGAPIITTGNELAGRQIVEFSRRWIWTRCTPMPARCGKARRRCFGGFPMEIWPEPSATRIGRG